MFEYVFPLTESFPSHIFYSSVASIGHMAFLTHVGSERCMTREGLKTEKIFYREGSSTSDILNLYIWFSSEKTEEELKIIYQNILESIEEYKLSNLEDQQNVEDQIDHQQLV